MSSKASRKNNKRSFDAARNTMWSFDPDELCIIGGKKMPANERGPLDTDDGPEHELYDPRIAAEPLTEEFVNNIDAYGVDTPILIANHDGRAIVIVGKTRVRAARVANRRRKSRGEPPIKVDCKIKRGNSTSLLAAMIVENENRRDDGMLAKIEKLKRIMNRGVSTEDAAVIFGVGVPTIKTWLAFEDNAIPATKKAAEQGRISASTAATVARIKDPAEQQKVLEDTLATEGKPSRRAAQLAAKRVDASKVAGVTDKRTQRRLLAAVQNASHGKASEKTLAWWEGVEEALKLVIGEEDIDQRLVGKLDETVSLMKTEKRAKKIAAVKAAEKSE
jgi:ParB family transcriptional regulator, chromosome partitioning protein